MKKSCDWSQCERPAHARGLCGAHYMEAKRRGKLPETRNNTQRMPLEDRLKFYGWRVTESGCWEWNGNRFTNGYGQLYVEGQKRLTHRLAYELWVGEIPDGHVIRHKCDNPPCINPQHLETGTDSDNKQDMLARGRDRIRGSRSTQTRFTEDDIRMIRSQAVSGARGTLSLLAKQHSVSYGTIYAIVTRRTWAHVR